MEAVLAQVKKCALVALDDSVSSKAVLDFLSDMSLCNGGWHIVLAHFYRKPMASEELMGRKFTRQQPEKMYGFLNNARDKLVENGCPPDRIEIDLVTISYPTIAEGIIEQVKNRQARLVVIGRKKLSKAEEFVKGDISVKLVRAIEGTAVLVVKTP